ncbi:MAG: NYN domain-containing protein [Nitrospirota bacterium]|nr:NYN domain-containing protein [Nitrospirota bacterium]
MSSIIVDGYNLTGTSHGDLAGQRESLVSLLIRYKKIRGHDITVVFDGWQSGGGREVSLTTGGVKVIYSRLGEKADYVIKRIIRLEKKEWIVISSDREIMAAAWACGSVPVSSDKFLSIIEKTEKSLHDEYGRESEEEEDYGPVHRKGNPRQPSKKDRALARTLEKL